MGSTRRLLCANTGSPTWQAVLAIGQHAVYANESIPVRTRKVAESIPVQKWNSLQGGQVHYTDTAVGWVGGQQMTAL